MGSVTNVCRLSVDCMSDFVDGGTCWGYNVE
jgi:hypothetical protein